MTTTNQITNSDDVIDSRDVIARIEELKGRIPHSVDEVMVLDDGELEEICEELEPLEDLQEQCSGYSPDWEHGSTLIRDSYFKEYAMELAEDIGAVNADATWPNNCIDWDQAARELRMDYTSVSFAGVDYWVR